VKLYQSLSKNHELYLESHNGAEIKEGTSLAMNNCGLDSPVVNSSAGTLKCFARLESESLPSCSCIC